MRVAATKYRLSQLFLSGAFYLVYITLGYAIGETSNVTYRILTRTAVTNILLCKMGVSETNMCMRCNRYADTKEHRFWECFHGSVFMSLAG